MWLSYIGMNNLILGVFVIFQSCLVNGQQHDFQYYANQFKDSNNMCNQKRTEAAMAIFDYFDSTLIGEKKRFLRKSLGKTEEYRFISNSPCDTKYNENWVYLLPVCNRDGT